MKTRRIVLCFLISAVLLALPTTVAAAGPAPQIIVHAFLDAGGAAGVGDGFYLAGQDRPLGGARVVGIIDGEHTIGAVTGNHGYAVLSLEGFQEAREVCMQMQYPNDLNGFPIVPSVTSRPYRCITAERLGDIGQRHETFRAVYWTP